MLTKDELKQLPKVVGDEAERQMEYVQAILGGMEKPEALNEFFPELHELAVERSRGNPQVVKANVTAQINKLERKSVVKKMYEVAHKGAWTNFVAKKHKLYENLYKMATDEDVSVRDRISSTKVMLDHMPKFEEDKTLIVEVKDGKQDFLDSLRAMQIALHKQANKDVIEIDAIEVEDGS
jgi:hypothetical protein